MANFFTDRSVEFPGRYRLTPTEDTNVFDLVRQEGTIYNAGTPLNAENLNGAMQEVIDQIPAANVFIAEKDTTTYAEVTAALQAGMVVFATVANSYGTFNVYPYAFANATEYHFIKVDGPASAPQFKELVLNSSNTWTTGQTAISSNQFIIGGLKMCWGQVSLSTLAGNSYVDITADFPSVFSAAPNVMVCQVSVSVASAYAAIEVAVNNVTTSKATFRFFNNSGTPRVPIANWLAIGPA